MDLNGFYANNLLEPLPSAYRSDHSTETAALRVHNDIICALGDNKCVLLVMLGVSTAFHAVNHQHLTNNHEHAADSRHHWYRPQLVLNLPGPQVSEHQHQWHSLQTSGARVWCPTGVGLGAIPLHTLHFFIGQSPEAAQLQLPHVCR